MAKIQLLGETLEYEEEMSNLPPVLFLHGFNSALSFTNPLKKLARSYRIVALNFPGSGQSTFNQKITFERYVALAKAFIKAKKLHHLTVVGHSLGGAVAAGLSSCLAIERFVLLAPFNPFVAQYANHNLEN